LNTWEDIEKLEEDWDSYGAAPIDPRAIETGKYLEKVLITNFPNIQKFPSPDGGVSFEDNHNTIDIGPDGQIESIWSDED